MPGFPHLTLKQKLDGRYQFTGGGKKELNPQTGANLNNRIEHGSQLTNAIKLLSQDHVDFLEKRKRDGLPQVFDEDIVPVFLQVDPKDFDIESLKGFGIEIVSEEQDGFIIGAN